MADYGYVWLQATVRERGLWLRPMLHSSVWCTAPLQLQYMDFSPWSNGNSLMN